MADARKPHVETLERLQAFVGLNDMRDIALIEIATSDPATTPGVTPVPMAAMTSGHFDQVHHEAEAKNITGMPRYFKRAPHGIHLHPRPDKPYWLRATYRKPVTYSAGQKNADGTFTRT